MVEEKIKGPLRELDSEFKNDPIARLNHACRKTCGGWFDGFEAGREKMLVWAKEYLKQACYCHKGAIAVCGHCTEYNKLFVAETCEKT